MDQRRRQLPYGRSQHRHARPQEQPYWFAPAVCFAVHKPGKGQVAGKEVSGRFLRARDVALRESEAKLTKRRQTQD